MSGKRAAPPGLERPAALVARDLVVGPADGSWRVELPALEIPLGAVGALVGPSGCGKSTLLRVLAGHRPPRGMARQRGEIQIAGEPLPPPDSGAARSLLRRPVTWLPQDAHGVLDPLRRLGAQLAEIAGGSEADLAGPLADLGLTQPEALLRRHPWEVSGGEAERLLLAAGLARYRGGRPGLLVVDEPTAHLDEGTGGQALALLRDHSSRPGSAVLVATHDHAALHTLGASAWNARGLPEGGTRFSAGLQPPAPWPDWRSRRVGPGDAVVLAAAGLRLVRGRRRILDRVDLSLRAGEVLALVGPSGAGKTTLGRVLAGLLTPDQGTVERPPALGRASPVQFVFQDARDSLTPRRRLGPLVRETAAPGFDPAAIAFTLNLPTASFDRTGARLSGGEARRAALLRALSVGPRVLILDEPTAGLDRQTATQMTDLLQRLRDHHGVAIVAITHDRGWARAFGDRVLTMVDGRVTA